MLDKVNRRPSATLPLDERIVLAFEGDDLTVDALTDLLAEVDAESKMAAEACEKAKEALLSPTLRPAALDDAKRFAEAAETRRDRLALAASRLPDRLADARRREQRARIAAEHEAARAERDALAAELASTYPDLARTMVDLLSRLAANNQRIAAIQRSGYMLEPLRSAEAVARSLPANWEVRPASGLASLLLCHLPAFTPDAPQWPPQSGRF
ncbi:hypothetical protein [Methylocella sp. CPCC 101449]|uniref:hypothetical protein n=1 Tax=Methylocella sp. CPCC 101449 TaxID=2987531 RepID=UPI00288E143A|nr:hypothetical protein [Methylocella sp. CPCC 101449]MDT2022818.1 hypothetical protein [Methylocella sp. CPCC 101449]